MKTFKNTIHAGALAGCLTLFAAGCHQPDHKSAVAAVPAPGVAQVGSCSIGAEEFRHLLLARAAGNPQAFATLADKKALLDELILREAAYQNALAAGFDRRPEIQEAVKHLITEKFQDEQRAADPANVSSVSETQMASYYQSHSDEFTQPPAVRGAAIFIKIPASADSAHRDRLVAKAQSILDQAKASPQQFARLAEQNSEDQASRYRGGDTGWLNVSRKDTINHELADALLAVPAPGGFAPLVTVKNGIWIAKLTDSRPAEMQPLAQVRELISYRLTRERNVQREKNLATRMKSGLAISVNEDLLNSINPPPAPPPVAPAMLPPLAQAQ